MSVLVDILRIRKMIAPAILEILFWAGVAGTLYGAYWLFTHDHWAWWIVLVFGWWPGSSSSSSCLPSAVTTGWWKYAMR